MPIVKLPSDVRVHLTRLRVRKSYVYMARAGVSISIAGRKETLFSSGCSFDSSSAEIKAYGEIHERIVGLMISVLPSIIETIGGEYSLFPEIRYLKQTVIPTSDFNIPAPYGKQDSTGLAVGPSISFASNNAVLEVLERHCLVGAWSYFNWPVIEVGVGNLSPKTYQLIESSFRNVNLFLLNDLSPPFSILSIVCDQNGRKLTLGAAAKWNLRDACDHATLEAFKLGWSFENTSEGRLALVGDIDALTRSSLKRAAICYEDGRDVLYWFVQQAKRRAEAAAISSIKKQPYQRIFAAFGNSASRGAKYRLFSTLLSGVCDLHAVQAEVPESLSLTCTPPKFWTYGSAILVRREDYTTCPFA